MDVKKGAIRFKKFYNRFWGKNIRTTTIKKYVQIKLKENMWRL